MMSRNCQRAPHSKGKHLMKIRQSSIVTFFVRRRKTKWGEHLQNWGIPQIISEVVHHLFKAKSM